MIADNRLTRDVAAAARPWDADHHHRRGLEITLGLAHASVQMPIVRMCS